MKAVGYTQSLPASNPECLLDLNLPEPTLRERDLLVRVKAISVNPVDTKIRKNRAPQGEPVVLGWDVAGVVEKIGKGVQGFQVGDEVYYAGDITRPGGNSELHAVDERITALKPRGLSFAQAAAVPLTALTAWEAVYEQLGASPERVNDTAKILILGGAGGVGSIATQMARLAGVRVIATASRPETIAWVREMGAHEVVDHRQPLAPQLEKLGIREVDFIFNTADTVGYWDQMASLIKPFGKIVSIVETTQSVDLAKLMPKSASFSWELMFTRSMFQTPDQSTQGKILAQVAAWLEEGKLKTTLTQELTGINASSLREAHKILESGTSRGKLVITGW